MRPPEVKSQKRMSVPRPSFNSVIRALFSANAYTFGLGTPTCSCYGQIKFFQEQGPAYSGHAGSFQESVFEKGVIQLQRASQVCRNIARGQSEFPE
eukprot:scaffold79042_cov15-Tisochrysis_lutea.AAC.1